MKVKKKVLIPVLVIVVLVAAVVIWISIAAAKVAAAPKFVDTYTVGYTDLVNVVSTTGTVDSADVTNVYSTLPYTVKTIDVEVGDRVNAGDTLCRLDTEALESTIAQTQAGLLSAQAKASHSVNVAKKNMENNNYNTNEDFDTAILNAQSALEKAENALRASQHDVSKTRKDLRDLQDDKKQVPDGEIYDEYIANTRLALTKYEIAAENAQIAVEDAKENLATQKKKKQDQLAQISDAGQDALKSAQLNANMEEQQIAFEKLKKDLSDAEVTAPVSGTVTAVLAKEGASGAGLLFVIEDTDNLKIVTKVKEYDIVNVSEGLPVIIKSDAIVGSEFDGEVSKVAPTTLKDPTGKTISTNSAEFETEVKVTSPSTLRVGMNARLNIILEKKENVLTVPFEAIMIDENGDTVVYVMDMGAEQVGTARKVVVTPGMETDFYSEIVSGDIKEGDIVITNPSNVSEGMHVMTFAQVRG